MKKHQRPYWQVPSLLEKTKAHEGIAKERSCSMPEGLDNALLRQTDPKDFPEISEFEAVRHYTQLSQLNFSIDGGTYPLGSCTMKYNPKVNETVAAMDGFAKSHPMQDQEHAQGSLAVMYHLQEALKDITGLKACALSPAAGAQGEFVGVNMIQAYQRDRGNTDKTVILVPDSAHGTNPASAALCGFSVRELKSNEHGIISVEELRKQMGDDVAGIMITVPNTLGIFEKNIKEIADLLHAQDALVYCDGANLNALVGQVDFGKMGVDVMHINLHKTFSTPHGGGGPGAGPVVVSDRLVDHLPIPVIDKTESGFVMREDIPKTIGRVRSFHGNFGMFVRALCYIYAYGREGIKDISDVAVLNANYVKALLKGHYTLPFDEPSMHEVVFSDRKLRKEHGVTTLDVAKRLMDHGFHPPTIYFPLVVEGALMIEPTETESKRELDALAQALIDIAEEAKTEAPTVQSAPHNTGFRRMDETAAARKPVLTWSDNG